jgi:hypothetical protein
VEKDIAAGDARVNLGKRGFALEEIFPGFECQRRNAGSLRMTPDFFNSVAMRRVEKPGRSRSVVFGGGVLGA